MSILCLSSCELHRAIPQSSANLPSLWGGRQIKQSETLLELLPAALCLLQTTGDHITAVVPGELEQLMISEGCQATDVIDPNRERLHGRQATRTHTLAEKYNSAWTWTDKSILFAPFELILLCITQTLHQTRGMIHGVMIVSASWLHRSEARHFVLPQRCFFFLSAKKLFYLLAFATVCP